MSAGELEEQFVRLHLCVMGKAADLKNFDKGQILISRMLGTIIFKTTRLVGCLLSTVVSIYAKRMSVGDISSRRHGIAEK